MALAWVPMACERCEPWLSSTAEYWVPGSLAAGVTGDLECFRPPAPVQPALAAMFLDACGSRASGWRPGRPAQLLKSIACSSRAKKMLFTN